MGFLPVLAEIADKMPKRGWMLFLHLNAGVVLFALGCTVGRWALLLVPAAVYWILMAVDEFCLASPFRDAVLRELGAGYSPCAVAGSCLPLAGLLLGVWARHLALTRLAPRVQGAGCPGGREGQRER